MKFMQSYTAKFLSDGTDQLTFDIADPPLNIEGTPSELTDLTYTPENVPASPFIKDFELTGTTITVNFAAPLPEKNINQMPANYKLNFTLMF